MLDLSAIIIMVIAFLVCFVGFLGAILRLQSFTKKQSETLCDEDVSDL